METSSDIWKHLITITQYVLKISHRKNLKMVFRKHLETRNYQAVISIEICPTFKVKMVLRKQLGNV
jgi:hypothetical protein